MSFEEKRRVRDGYNDLGGDLYSLRYREEQEVKYDTVFGMISVGLDDLVLDDGCGSGMLMENLACGTVGFDLSSELLAAARRKLKPLHHLVQGDAEKLPFRGEAFTSVISVTLLQNTPSPIDALKEIRRVTREGGGVAVTVLKRAMTPERFRSLLEEAKFREISLLSSEEGHDWFASAKR